jgi:hypothetical protein
MADQMGFRVTPEQVEAAKSKLAETGFPISGDSSAVEKDGYRIGYSLVEGVLTLQILAKPRFVPMMRRSFRNPWHYLWGTAVSMPLRLLLGDHFIQRAGIGNSTA